MSSDGIPCEQDAGEGCELALLRCITLSGVLLSVCVARGSVGRVVV